MSREDDIKDILNETTKAFYAYDSNPSTWVSWIVYLLQNLQQSSMDVNPTNQESYREMLARLDDVIKNRLRTGGW